MNCSRACGSVSPRGSNKCRARKKPVRAKPSRSAAADGALMAGSLLGSLPVALFYSLFVDYYVSSLTGAVKE